MTNSHRMDRGNEEKGARGASKKTRGLVVVGDTRDVDFVGGKKKRFFLFSFFARGRAKEKRPKSENHFFFFFHFVYNQKSLVSLASSSTR